LLQLISFDLTLQVGEGPIAIVLSPTRELCEQIWREVKRFGKILGLTSVAVFGGAAKWAQVKAVKAGAEIVVATPGRLIDMLKAKACNTRRTTILVLDEADQMFSMGTTRGVQCSNCNVRVFHILCVLVPLQVLNLKYVPLWGKFALTDKPCCSRQLSKKGWR